MGLRAYKTKRDFTKTKEPKPKKKEKTSSPLSFVIQKHDARRLHYDLRLEADGVLKSWAVPKGPSLDPGVKRLAIEVEDHPLDYGSFEGTIPEGNYGAGKVIVWDNGTYEPENVTGPNKDKGVLEALKKGKLTFILHGHKLKGEFSLVRLASSEKKNEWLLIKKSDSYESKEDVTKQDQSVLSDRTIETPIIEGKKAKMPHLINPMLGTLVEEPFNKKGWIFEVKWDGYRAIAEIYKKTVELYSRNHLSFNHQFAPIVDDLKKFKKEMILDGEVVVLDKEGLPNFQMLQNYLNAKDTTGFLCYYVFDILYYEGYDLKELPLIQRKTLLKEVLEDKVFKNSRIIYSDHIEEKGVPFFKEAKKKDLEGIIAKLSSSPYIEKRSKNWLKIKTHQMQEVIVGGFTSPRGSRKHLGALLVGYYKKDKFVYAGHVGGGFNEKSLKEMEELLAPLIQEKCPFEIKPKANASVLWVKPKIVVEVSFQEWTKEGIMRQPIFHGVRVDKAPKKITREEPLSKTETDKLEKKNEKNNVIEEIATNPQKVYWPKEGYTKEDLLKYYEKVSPYMLPHLKDRPIVLQRFPNGIKGHSFYQKEAPEFTPGWMPTVEVEHSEKTIRYLLANDLKSLLYIVNLGSIEIHPFLSRFEHIDEPDYLVIDLDPADLPFEAVIPVAQEVKKILDLLKVKSYPKISGKRGLHVYLPLQAKYSYEDVETIAKLLAHLINDKLPNETSLIRDPKKRKKKVYIDYLQNGRTKTVVAAYSVRPVEGAQVAAPLEWKEVRKGLEPSLFTIETMIPRLKKKGDLFKPLLRTSLSLEKLLKNIEKEFSV